MLKRKKQSCICRNCERKFYSCFSSFGKYCSIKCQKLFENKTRILNWLNGEINPINSNGLLRPWARRYIFEKFNNKCIVCGWNKLNRYTGKIPLEIDHIDGNYRNNAISNLRLLCPNCHSLTSSYKSLNKGKGRKRN